MYRHPFIGYHPSDLWNRNHVLHQAPSPYTFWATRFALVIFLALLALFWIIFAILYLASINQSAPSRYLMIQDDRDWRTVDVVYHSNKLPPSAKPVILDTDNLRMVDPCDIKSLIGCAVYQPGIPFWQKEWLI